jgi:hypothetical protein
MQRYIYYSAVSMAVLSASITSSLAIRVMTTGGAIISIAGPSTSMTGSMWIDCDGPIVSVAVGA